MAHFTRYNQILFWTLEITDGGDKFDPGSDWLAKGGHWKRLEDRLQRGTTEDPDVLYSEYVYFHRFAQEFLYSKYGERFQIFGRDDVKSVLVRASAKPWEAEIDEERFDVRRVHLYLFKTQIAILVVELEADRDISRRAALALQDQFRRVYPPFFSEGKGGLVPEYVQWQDETGLAVGAPSNYHSPDDLKVWNDTQAILVSPQGEEWKKQEIAFLRETSAKPLRRDSEIPMAAHWEWLLPGELKFDHIEDERLPQMHHLETRDPHLISRGDMVRMCFADGDGDPGSLPYSPEFLSNFEEKHCYDRFWSKLQSGLGTRYMCCGYGFTMLTDNGWFASNILRNHFRHHYFQLGLLSHYHRASLLRFSRRLSESTGPHQDEVRANLAEFTNQHWFHEATNQDQGRELFMLWSRQLGNETIFRQVHEESRAAAEIRRMQETREQEGQMVVQAGRMENLNRRVDVLTNRLVKLALLTFLVAAVALVVAFLDTEAIRDTLKNLLHETVDKPGERPVVVWRSWRLTFWIVFVVFFALMTWSVIYFRRMRGEIDKIDQATKGPKADGG